MSMPAAKQLADLQAQIDALAAHSFQADERHQALIEMLHWLLTRHPQDSLRCLAEKLTDAEDSTNHRELTLLFLWHSW